MNPALRVDDIMVTRFTEPRIIERKPCFVIGFFAEYQGDDEGPGWDGAYRAFSERRNEITNRTGTCILGFLYRPHKDHPEISHQAKACFIGVSVNSFECIPEGMKSTEFPGGNYVVMKSIADTQDEASQSVGDMVDRLEHWIRDNGYEEGDACFAASDEADEKPPYGEYVYIHFR